MFEILQYNSNLEKRWDDFVMEESVNGIFLQTRRFLNYHPEGRFRDASFLVALSGIIVSAFPGVLTEDGVWISHPGSTFGGPVVSRYFYTVERLSRIVDSAESYLKTICRRAILRPTSDLFARESSALLQYVLEHKGYSRQSELSSVCSLHADRDPLKDCDTKCRNVFRKSVPFNLIYRDMADSEIPEFYQFLCVSKAKHNAKPVHTVEELLDLRHNRIPEEVSFKSLWMGDTYVAGMMMFDFRQTNVRHVQYLAPNYGITLFQPTTAMNVSVMREAAKEGISKFSWGISTEDCGEYLNIPLAKFKESFGARSALNLLYSKEW